MKQPYDLRNVTKAMPTVQQAIGKALCKNAGHNITMDFHFDAKTKKNGAVQIIIKVNVSAQEVQAKK